MTGADSKDSGLDIYLPIKPGNSWTYSGAIVNTAVTSDSTVSGPVVLSVFQSNVLIGGEPNAFIVREANSKGDVTYLAFSLMGNTLWHFLGSDNTLPVKDSLILWIPEGVGGAVVGFGQTQDFHISDEQGNSASYSIVRNPDSSIARAYMAAPDTMQVTGVSIGQTTLKLQKLQGLSSDTMVVVIGVTSDQISSVNSPLHSWVPIWQLTDSKTDEVVFSWDTTYSFRCVSDSTRITDELHYSVTNRFVDSEVLNVLNATLHCDKYESQLMVTETITEDSEDQNEVLFTGPSGHFVLDLWLAKGIGFVKGIVNGNSRSLIVAMGGEQDSTGLLKGFYLSPRVVYASGSTSAVPFQQYLEIDNTQLAPSQVLKEFILTGMKLR